MSFTDRSVGDGSQTVSAGGVMSRIGSGCSRGTVTACGWDVRGVGEGVACCASTDVDPATSNPRASRVVVRIMVPPFSGLRGGPAVGRSTTEEGNRRAVSLAACKSLSQADFRRSERLAW